MSERFTSDLVFILIVLLIAALLGFLIGYFIRRYKHLKCSQLEDEIAQLKLKLENCQQEKQALLNELNNKTGKVFDDKAASADLDTKL
jgi:hypothetical protein